MASNGKDEVMVSDNQSHASASSAAMVEIKIKTLDSQTYTLRVDKYVPVPALKEQIASVTGVVSEEQRLICRGKVLKDDQLLSAYHVEDGHTLHLVVRQPVPPLSESLPGHPVHGLASSADDSQETHRPHMVVGTFDITGQGDGPYPDAGQIVSAVLGSLGITGLGGLGEFEVVEASHEGLLRASASTEARDSGVQRSDHPFALNGTTNPSEPLQAPEILDSLTTLSQYLNHLRDEFVQNGQSGNNLQDSGATREDVAGSDATPHVTAATGGLPGPSDLAEVMLSTRRLLTEQAAECLSTLARQLQDQANVTDPSTRTRMQMNVLGSGALLQNLGASLLELGRSTMMLRLGQTPADAVVNSGPSVFVSSSGPSPIMVQPQPFQLGTSSGTIPIGSARPSATSSGTLGSRAVPRNIEIRIRSGSRPPPTTTNQREQTGQEPSSGQTNPVVTGTQSTIRQILAASSGVPSSSRVRPVRTLVAAIPTITVPTIRRPSPGIRVQQPSTAYRRRVRSSPSSQHSPSELDAEQQRQQENIDLPGIDGNHNSSSGVPIEGGLSDLHSRLDEMLRPTIGHPHITMTTNSATVPAETSAAMETEIGASDEGTFLSNILRQIMPVISENIAMTSTAGASNTDNQESNAGTSNQQSEEATPPDAKRQKRE